MYFNLKYPRFLKYLHIHTSLHTCINARRNYVNGTWMLLGTYNNLNLSNYERMIDLRN